MIQLNILSGKKAGTAWVARRFPVRIGRSPAADLQLAEDGVWEQHLQLDFKPRDGFFLTTQPNALVTLNGQPVQQSRLHNGDSLEMGALKMRFWLSQTRQAGLRFREALTWAAIAALCLAQIALIYWLPA
ncbi:MAG: FHA domain-containing protein [Verrucomicrobiota bacterium]